MARRTCCRVLAWLLLFAPTFASSAGADEGFAARCRAAASRVRIVRDDWGIAHVHGVSDADAVFGMIYAQAEDDFPRVETNYLNALGRLAEAEGESAVYQDLRMKLFIRPEELESRYAASPPWLRALMQAWADGLNCFLASHAEVQPRVLRHFEPWMALSFSEGSIGGDIEQVKLAPLADLYGGEHRTARLARDPVPREPGGSNGIAIAPGNTRDHHALLLINPHTTFFFRSELQMSSDDGLNAYGAVTWGQFFIYQGFNERVGWMHTSSGVNNVDFFRETIVWRGGKPYYRYGDSLRPVSVARVSVPYRTTTGEMAVRDFTTYRTHHGPVVRREGDHWISIALMQRPVEALTQSFQLTKARDHAAFMRAMALQANSSNNTVYADADGNIAYLHPQFVPRRDDRFDYTKTVDGADPRTDWKGLHTLDEVPHLLNPPSGWIANTNNWPYSAAGASSPKAADYPRYMDTAGENPRGLHAQSLLAERRDFTADALNVAAYDPYLPAFERVLPALLRDYDGLPAADPLRASLADPIAVLRAWDHRSSTHSVATTLAVLWGDELWQEAKQEADDENVSVYEALADRTSPQQKMETLASVCRRLSQDFGSWRVPWGEMNRFQRTTRDINPTFSDQARSTPIPFASGRWGALASFGARRYEGTSRYYGTSGNTFVAIVEFGPRVSARAVSIGGESGDPESFHFSDQTARYADGALRKVYFYADELTGHIERQYRPE